MLSESEPAHIKIAEEEQLRDDNFSYHSAASSSWSLAGRLQQEEKQETHEDSDAKVWILSAIYACHLYCIYDR